jgi:proteasome lid subunit RPN8/RPN11
MTNICAKVKPLEPFFLEEIQKHRRSGKEHGFLIYQNKEGKLIKGESCFGTSCMVRLEGRKNAVGTFHTHESLPDFSMRDVQNDIAQQRKFACVGNPNIFDDKLGIVKCLDYSKKRREIEVELSMLYNKENLYTDEDGEENYEVSDEVLEEFTNNVEKLGKACIIKIRE